MLNYIKRKLFLPLTCFMRMILRLRVFLYEFGYFESIKFGVPVISVGNIELGGSGKTPFCLWLAKEMERRNLNPLIVSRGYKSKRESSFGLIDANNRDHVDSREYGDEPVMLSRNLSKSSVVVGKNRVVNIFKFFQKSTADYMILEDGYQHLKIKRDVNILLINTKISTQELEIFPAGKLREDIDGVKRADVVIFTYCEEPEMSAPEKLLYSKISPFLKPNVLFMRSRAEVLGFKELKTGNIISVDEMSKFKGVCFSSIATPEKFHRLLSRQGIHISSKMIYPDHHYFTNKDLAKLDEIAQKSNSVLICTEKDEVKVSKNDFKVPIYSLLFKLEFYGEESTLLSRVMTVNK